MKNRLSIYTALFCTVLLCSTLFCACASSPQKNTEIPESSVDNFEIQWQALKTKDTANQSVSGFYMCSARIETAGVSWHCVKIDLDTPGLDYLSYPQKNNVGKNYNVRELAKKHNALVAFNTTPFDLKGKAFIPVGISQYKNQLIKEPEAAYCALSLYKTKTQPQLRAKIYKTQSEILSGTFYDDGETSFYGGFFSIMEDGKIKEFEKNRRSRVGIGISDCGRFLYILVATPVFSLTDKNGLNYEECAAILKKLGCTDAMQFDGGHSSALVVNGKDVEKPFLQRKVPTVLLFGLTLK